MKRQTLLHFIFCNSMMLITLSIGLLWNPLQAVAEDICTAKKVKKQGHETNCERLCGNVSIPYPFGMGDPHCYWNESFIVTCTNSSFPAVPFLKAFELQLLNVSYITDDFCHGTVEVKIPTFTVCGGNSSNGNGTTEIRWTSPNVSPFYFSSDNVFTTVGCDGYAALYNDNGELQTMCSSVCSPKPPLAILNDAACRGYRCCSRKIFRIELGNRYSIGVSVNNGPRNCTSAFLAHQDSLETSGFLQHTVNALPVTLRWGPENQLLKHSLAFIIGYTFLGIVLPTKRSGSFDENQWKQFINEVILLSQIKHKHVVKLLGCCLETNVPLLVYEFIPNGTLSECIQNNNVDFFFSWEMRLRIASETASAIAYLHCDCPTPIYHRDIKSSNILLDDEYRAKLSDFGISKEVSEGQTHLTTCVQGTFGYLDPEYFQSSQFSEKSDVYSFGAVLVELLTGQKPTNSVKFAEEDKELPIVEYFILSLSNSTWHNVLDPVVLEGTKIEDIMVVAELAKQCLNPRGVQRPNMKEVSTILQGLIRQNSSTSSFTISMEVGNNSRRPATLMEIEITTPPCSEDSSLLQAQ